MRAARVTLLVVMGLVASPLAGCAATASPVAQPASTARRAVDGWPTTSPARAGLDPQRLRSLAREAKRLDSTCYAVIRRGRLVGDWNWGTSRLTPREVFSVTKSVTSALVGIAVRDGALALDDRVSRYVPQWRRTDSKTVTVRNLLSNDSGRYWSIATDYGDLVQAPNRTKYAVRIGQQHAPGSAWAYNNAAIQVLDRVLVEATGVRTADFAAERLFEPLGMTHTRMTSDSSGRSTNIFFGLQTTCLDLARFGQLYLEHGKIGRTRILPTRYVRASVGRSSTELNAAYGYLWWLNRYGALRGATDQVDAAGQPVTPHEGRLVPDAAPNLFSAIGLGGQIAMVDPASRTVVVRIGSGQASPEGAYGLRDAARVVTWATR